MTLDCNPSSTPHILLDILASDGSIHDTRVLTPTIGDSIRIGRISSDKSKGFNANVDNALFDSRVMSRQHAEIEVTTGLPGPLFIKDTSKYGTFVNDKRMAKGQPTMISDGDQLTFGNTVTDTNTGISHHPIKAQIHFNQRDPSPIHIDTQPHRSFKCPSESELDEDDDDDDFDDFESHVEADDLPQDYPLSDSESPTPSDVWADDDSAWEAEHADDDDDYYPVFYQSDCALPFNSRDVSPSYSTESSSDSICEPVGPPPHPQLAAQHASEPPTITVLDASNPVVTVGDLAPVEPDTFSSNGRHADSQLPEPAVRTRVSRFDKEAPPQPHPHPETTNAITSQNIADPHRKSRFDRPAYRPAEMRPASAYVGLNSQAGPRPCPSTFSSDLSRGSGTSLPPWRKMMGVPMHDARSYRYGPDHVAEYTPMDWYEPSFSHHPVDLVPNYGVATPSAAPPFPGVRFRNWDFVGHEAPRNAYPKVPMDFLLNTGATPAASQPANATAPDAEASSHHRSPPKPRADSRLAIDHLLEPKGTPTAPVASNIAAGKKRKADELATPELSEAKPILSTPVAQTSAPDQVTGLATPPSSEPSLSPPAKRLKHAVSSALTAGAYAALGSIATIGFLASPLAERLAGF